MASDLIQTPQAVWKRGAYEATTVATPLMLVGRVRNAAAESRYSRLFIPGAAAGYQVTTGKTLYITKLIWTADTAGIVWQLGSATADAGDNQIAAPAGWRSETSGDTTERAPFGVPTNNTTATLDIIIPIAASRYLAIRGLDANSALFVIALAHEL